ncbi:CBWD5 [Symbiodinium sp. CCMP2592]|nr:CBWD5 [Symbiodinium sp. CCMP2592]
MADKSKLSHCPVLQSHHVAMPWASRLRGPWAARRTGDRRLLQLRGGRLRLDRLQRGYEAWRLHDSAELAAFEGIQYMRAEVKGNEAREGQHLVTDYISLLRLWRKQFWRVLAFGSKNAPSSVSLCTPKRLKCVAALSWSWSAWSGTTGAAWARLWTLATLNQEAWQQFSLEIPPVARALRYVVQRSHDVSCDFELDTCSWKCRWMTCVFAWELRDVPNGERSSMSMSTRQCTPVVWIGWVTLWPQLLSNFLWFLWCVPIEEDAEFVSRLFPDPDIVCWSSVHRPSVYIAIAGLSVWCLGIPVALLCRLLTLDDIHAPDTYRKYGFFIDGFEPLGLMFLVTYTSIVQTPEAKVLLFPVLSGLQLWRRGSNLLPTLRLKCWMCWTYLCAQRGSIYSLPSIPIDSEPFRARDLQLDPVLARLVKKNDYAPKLAKRAADEYRKFLVLMGMGETPIASKMVLDAWHSHIMPPVRNISALLVPGSSRETRYTKMYERDCQEVFGHQLENDPLGEQLEETRLKQTQQQICDYFGMVDRLVWSAAKPAALSESTDPSDIAAIMDQWLDHINEEVVLRKGLLAEDVHVMVASQHTNTAVPHTGLENALSFFHHYSHATKARKFLSADHEAFAIEIQKGKRMGADIFEVDSDGKILDVKIFMATLFKDVDDLNDAGLENLTVHYTGNGSMAMVQVGEAGGALTKAAMETWMLNFNNNAAEKHDLLAADVHLTHMSQVTDAPETRDGKAEVIDFFRDFENATGAREFLSVDGGAFMIENKGNNLHPRMGLLIFEVNPEGKIQDIKIWVASLQGDRDDLSDSGLTSVAPSLLGSRGEVFRVEAWAMLGILAVRLAVDLCSEFGAPGATEPAVCQQSGSRPSLQQMQRFNASVEKVKALDLDAVVAFLVKKDGYSPTKAAELAEEYRKYLALVSIGLSPVPSKKVDDAWHAHILNTKKYQADTRALLGHFLHHEPANLLLEQQGMKEQKSSMDNMFSRTKMQLCDYYGRVDEVAWSKEDNPVDLVVFVRVTWTIQVVRVPMRLVSATSLQMPAVIGVLFRCGRSRSGSAWLKSKIAVATFLSPTANPPWIDIAMKPACVVACLFALAFKAGVSADTLRVDGAGTDVVDARGTETADACQSGSLIQRLSSSHKVLSDTEATPAESLKKTSEIKEKKKKLKKQKSNKKHSDFMAFLAEAEKDGPGHPEGSECEPAGAPLLGENRAKFELLSQKVFALDLDPVLARLVKKSEYAPKLAKRAADEYRKFLVLMGMGETPIASKMVLDAWHSHIMYTKMYERDCQEVFGHQLEHDPLGEQLEETRLKQTQQQICDYFGMVDRLVWSAAKPAALSESTDPSDTAAIMDQWLDHINEEVVLRKGLLAEDVHVMVASQHTNTAVTHTGLENALSFFHHYSHATKARKFLSADHEAFAIEIQKGKRMGADIFEVDSDGKILDVKIFMATLFKDVDDLDDTGLENLTVHYTGNGSMARNTYPLQAMVQVGEAGGALTKAAMETWMLNFNNNAAEKHDLLAADVHLTHMSQVTDAPETRDGKAEVIDFFRDFENATGAREFLSVDGGAFMIENKGNNLHPRMGLLIFEVNPEGKIQDIKIWVASLQGDRDDLSDSGLTSVAPSLLGSRGEEASVSGATEPAVCQQSGSRPSLQQMQRFNASVEKVKALDLDAVVAFLVKKDGYSPTKAAELAEEYRKYLALVSIGLSPVPSKKVDDAWHAHILNTKKYQADTRALLGHFLHHEPANLLLEQQGMKEQKSSMDNMFSRTKMQLCDYYGRVDEVAWSKEDVALCSCGCQCGCGCSCGCACSCGCCC